MSESEKLIIVVHYFIAIYLLIFPVLLVFDYDQQFKLFNLIFGSLGVLAYLIYRHKGCPFTYWQNKIRKKSGLKEIESFKNVYMWRYIGINIPVPIISIYSLFVFILMIIRSI